jgi:hypothetical protein
MPEYRATRFINTREADTCHFTAASDEAAREFLLSGNIPEWSGDADLIEPDVADEVFALDRNGGNGTYETVDDEIELPGMMPYGQPSRDFVLTVAALSQEGTYDNAIDTLEALIEKARALCNISEAITPEPAPPVFRIDKKAQPINTSTSIFFRAMPPLPSKPKPKASSSTSIRSTTPKTAPPPQLPC